MFTMKKIIISFGIGLALFSSVLVFSPLKTEALSLSVDASAKLDALKGQLTSLLKQVEDTKKQIKEIETNRTDFCFNFDSSFGIGARGSQVVALHSALAREGFAVSSPEGQFDEQTGAAVTGLQEKYRAEILTPVGLKFGTGYMGPGTRTKLNTLFGCVRPAVTLKVLSPNGGESWKLGSTEIISWQSPADFRVASAQYDVYIHYRYPPCIKGPCLMYPLPLPRLIAKNISTNYYQWLVGDTVGDTTTLNPGNYLIRVCESGTSRCDSSDSQFSIYTSDASGNKPPVIHGFEAPTKLKVGVAGTWNIKASDPENGSLSYSIDWGDKVFDASAGTMPHSLVQESLKQQSSFTHAYSYPGEYKVIVTVRDSASATAQSSATIVVVAGEDPIIGTLKVRVLNGSIVCITTPCEFPLIGATIQVYDLGGTAILRSGIVDSDGYFTARDLKPYLTYPVRIVRGGYATQETKVYVSPGSNSLTVRLQTEPTLLPIQ